MMKEEDQETQLRKRKREENTNLSIKQDEGPIEGENVHNTSKLTSEQYQGVFSDDIARQISSTKAFRRIVSGDDPPIDSVIKTGVVPLFVKFLKNYESPQLQFEAAWALTNIASGNATQTKSVIDEGAVPIFVQLLDSPNRHVQEQSSMALSNIAGDSPQNRDLVLDNGALDSLLKVLSTPDVRISMTRMGVWCISNLCRGKNPEPNFQKVSPALPVLAKSLYSADEKVLTHTLRALSYLSNGSIEKIQEVIASGICRRVVELLMHKTDSVVKLALRTVGNITSGNDIQTQTILNCAALPCLVALLSSSNESHHMAACWAVSNITAGTNKQIQAVIDNNIVPLLISILETATLSTKKEALFAISNLTTIGTSAQIEHLVTAGGIPPLCDMLAEMDTKTIWVALGCIENILQAGEYKCAAKQSETNPYATVIEECQGRAKLESLQSYHDTQVQEWATEILCSCFNIEEDDNSEDSLLDMLNQQLTLNPN